MDITPEDIDRADRQAVRDYGHLNPDGVIRVDQAGIPVRPERLDELGLPRNPTRGFDPPVAYHYDASRWPDEVAAFHPQCLIEEMVDRRELSPAARDMGVEEVLNQHANANAIDRDLVRVGGGRSEDGVDTYDAMDFPASAWASNELAGQECGRCEQRILPPAEFTERQNLARDLAAHEWAMDRNDYDPGWTADADLAFGPKADEYLVAHRAIEQFRARQQGKALPAGEHADPEMGRYDWGMDQTEVRARARLTAPSQRLDPPRMTR